VSRLVLGVSASAAIFKACDLASKLTQEGHEVRALLTPNATRLVSLQLFEALTGQPAAASEWGAERRGGMDHITLARWAEVFVFAPATASSIARLAAGMADDLIGTLALALSPKTPRLLCPAMNPVMYAHPSVRRNLIRLCEDGWQVMEPESGRLACEDEGRGRLPEVAAILARVRELLD
jgi:phosphopantothenoylcysteine decarboxylase/phosphopantothenate--cysteine ligase